MQVNVEELSSVQRRVTVEIPAAEVDKTLDAIFKRIKKQARLKGFRPGKAPRAILEKYYGDQAMAEAAEQLIGKNYTGALDEAKVEPVAQPSFDFDPPQAGEQFTFKLTLDVRPEFELEKEAYQGIELKEPDFKVDDELINDRLEMLRERQAVTVALEEDRPAAIGDVVVANYTSFVDGEPVDGGSADNVEVELGKGQVPDEIEAALVKTKPGEMVEATVSYGDDSPNPELKDKDVVFKLLVKELKKKVLPELDDDFAKAVSPEFDGLDALKERIKTDTEVSYQEQKDAALRTQILNTLENLVEFELPSSLVDAEVEDMITNLKQRMKQQGMDPDAEMLDNVKMTEDFKPSAERKVKAGIVLGRIADMEEVEVADEDLDAHFEKMAGRIGQPAEVIKQMYNKNNMMSSLNAQLMEEKTLQVVKAGANIKLVDPTELAEETENSSN